MIHVGDCLDVLRTLDDCSVDAIVTDPPYGLAFMGKRWDYDVPSVDVWAECLRVLKPGGHLLAFAGTRTQHRMAVRIEDAGFEIRDLIAWVYGSGFPKSLDVSKAIDRHGGQSVAWFGPWLRKWREESGVTQKEVAALFPSKAGGLTGCVANWELGLNMPTPEQFNLIRDRFSLPFGSLDVLAREVIGQDTKARSTSGASALPTVGGETVYKTWDITAAATDAARQWEGWGTALKPALEPITVARKPLIGTVAANVLAHGTGALNIDGCRVGFVDDADIAGATFGNGSARSGGIMGQNLPGRGEAPANPAGRWPANLIHDGSDEVLAAFPREAGGGFGKRGGRDGATVGEFGMSATMETVGYGDAGSAARFFYCAKASKADREDGNVHPTVKPTDLMRYLCRLVTPPGGLVLDPFAGSGSTGKGAILEGFRFLGIERDPDYAAIAVARLDAAHAQRLEDEAERAAASAQADLFGAHA